MNFPDATAPRDLPPTHNQPTLLGLYEQMRLIREAETYCGRLFADGEIPGFIHLSDGQEATCVGMINALRPDDTIASTHRGHGHALAKVLSLDSFFMELMGREEGACKGRGGSMHVADLSVGMLGANGIVGGGIAIAVGSGLAHKLRGTDAIAVAFFGDGAMAEGVLHEAMNIAMLKRIPVIFACENNGWSEFSPTSTQVCFTLKGLADAYGMPFYHADGHDVAVVAELGARVIEQVRRTSTPVVVECMTTRIRGHYEGDSQRYRDQSRAVVDPIALTRQRLIDIGIGESEIDMLDTRIQDQVAASVDKARAAGEPTFESVIEDVYARGDA